MVDSKRRFSLVLCLTLLTVQATPAQSKSHGSSTEAKSEKEHSTKHASDENVLRNQAKEYERAFSNADAGTLANMWSPTGTFVDSTGQELQGRAAIEAMFVKLFKQIGKQPLSISVESIRFPAPTVAIEEGTSQITNPQHAGSIGHYTVTHVKRNGVWQMEAVTESIERTNTQTPPPTNSLADMSWLLGDWTTAGSSDPVHLHADWMANNKNFIKFIFIAGAAASAPDELQILGWNPRSGMVNIWNYASDGGFGYGRIIHTDADTWIEKASSMQPDGSVCSATYTFKKMGENAFTWRSTDRIRSGKSIPDTTEITLQRNSH